MDRPLVQLSKIEHKADARLGILPVRQPGMLRRASRLPGTPQSPRQPTFRLCGGRLPLRARIGRPPAWRAPHPSSGESTARERRVRSFSGPAPGEGAGRDGPMPFPAGHHPPARALRVQGGGCGTIRYQRLHTSSLACRPRCPCIAADAASRFRVGMREASRPAVLRTLQPAGRDGAPRPLRHLPEQRQHGLRRLVCLG